MKLKNIAFILISAFCFLPAPAQAGAESRFYDNFKSIPVLHEGRLKPLDTYARNLLIQFSGKDTYEHTPAVLWLAQLIFTPDKAVNDKVILINNPEIAVALNIKPEEHRRYSFGELKDSYAKLMELKDAANNIDEHQRSLVENEIIRVAENVEAYIDFSNEFIWVYPDSDFTLTSPQTKQLLGLPPQVNQFSFIDIADKADRIREMTLGLKDKP
jgi:hypothetical protein